MFAPRVAVFLAVLLTNAALCPAAAPPAVRRDADGDPLPPGAVARLGSLRLFHPGPVTFKAFTPDGRFLITAACGPGATAYPGAELFCVWDLRTGRRVRQFGHAGSVIYHAVSSPDGRRIVSVGSAGTFLWEVPGGRLVRQLEKEEDPEQEQDHQHDQYAFRDEKTLAGIRSRRVETLGLVDGRRNAGIRLFGENEYPGGPLVLSPDGKRIVTPWSRGIRVVDTATGKLRGKVRLGEGWAVAFHPGGKVFAVEHGPEGTVQIHDAETLRMLRSWKLGKGTAYTSLEEGRPTCVFVPGGNLLAAPGKDSATDLWDWSKGVFVRRLGEGIGHPYELTFSLDGKLVASGTGLGRIRVFDVARGKELLPSEGHRTDVGSIRYVEKNTLISAPLGNGPLLTWNARTGQVVRSGPTILFGDVISRDGKVRARPYPAGTVLLFDGATEEKCRLLGASSPGPPPERNGWSLFPPVVAFSPDGATLAYAEPEGPVRLWLVKTGEAGGRLGRWANRKRAKALAFSADGRFLAVGGSDRTDGVVEVWDTGKRKLLRRLTVPARPWKYPGDLLPLLTGITAVEFTPDGRAVAAVNSLGPVCLWEISSGRQLLRSDPNPHEVADGRAVACSRDGRLLASAGCEGIALWEIASGREVHRFRPTGGWIVRALAFSPDGRTLASGGDDPTILLWEVPETARVPKH